MYPQVLQMLHSFREWFSARSDQFLLVDTAQDVEVARDTGRLGVAFDLEGADCLGTQLERVAELHQLGVRWISVAYNSNNAFGGGCQDDDHGLTQLGVELLGAMEQAGIVVCCSHTGRRTTLDVLERAAQPVIFSHSNPLGAWRHPRNIGDDVIRRCAAAGGVVGINGIGIFLGRNDASVRAVTRHIEYVVDLVGSEHVALGLDYIYDRAELEAYVAKNPELFPSELGYTSGIAMLEPERLPGIADELLARGYSDSDVSAVLGGNWLRIANQCWH
jgi:membrane dipeptidase